MYSHVLSRGCSSHALIVPLPPHPYKKSRHPIACSLGHSLTHSPVHAFDSWVSFPSSASSSSSSFFPLKNSKQISYPIPSENIPLPQQTPTREQARYKRIERSRSKAKEKEKKQTPPKSIEQNRAKPAGKKSP